MQQLADSDLSPFRLSGRAQGGLRVRRLVPRQLVALPINRERIMLISVVRLVPCFVHITARQDLRISLVWCLLDLFKRAIVPFWTNENVVDVLLGGAQVQVRPAEHVLRADFFGVLFDAQVEFKFMLLHLFRFLVAFLEDIVLTFVPGLLEEVHQILIRVLLLQQLSPLVLRELLVATVESVR